MTTSRSIHVAANGIISFFLMAEGNGFKGQGMGIIWDWEGGAEIKECQGRWTQQ